jgi:hypothetical protein
MVTGDRADAAETIGAALDLDAVLADRVPSDKVDAVATEQRLHPTPMVGDGINDAPALAKAYVGIAMGAHGASASFEAADVIILVDRLDRVSDAVSIASCTCRIAVQSIIAGMAMSGITMAAAALGWLTPVTGGSYPGSHRRRGHSQRASRLDTRPEARTPSRAGRDRQALREDHERLEVALDRLRAIADALDDADPAAVVSLITEANAIVTKQIAAHEREDEDAPIPGFRSSSPTVMALPP